MTYKVYISNSYFYYEYSILNDLPTGVLEISSEKLILQFEYRKYTIRELLSLRYIPQFLNNWIELKFLLNKKEFVFYITCSKWFRWCNVMKTNEKIFFDLEVYFKSQTLNSINEYRSIHF